MCVCVNMYVLFVDVLAAFEAGLSYSDHSETVFRHSVKVVAIRCVHERCCLDGGAYVCDVGMGVARSKGQKLTHLTRDVALNQPHNNNNIV